MNTPALPPTPGGYQRIKTGTVKALSALRRSQAAQKLSDNVMLTIAVVFFLLASAIVVIGNQSTNGSATDIALNPSAEPTLLPSSVPIVDLSPVGSETPALFPGMETPTPGDIETTGTPMVETSEPFGTPRLSDSSPNPQETPAYPEPGPDGEPSPIGTSIVFPTSSGFEDGLPTFPPATFPPVVTFPPPGRATDPPSQFPTTPPFTSPTDPGVRPPGSTSIVQPTAPTPGNQLPTSPPPGYPPPGNNPPTNIPVDDTALPTFPGSDPFPPTPTGDRDDETTGPPATPPPGGSLDPTATPTAAPPPAIPTPAITVLRGQLRWSLGNSPIRLTQDNLLVAGSTLTIDPGVEVQIAPGASLTVDGTLNAQGTSANPVRFRRAGADNWESIVVTDNGVARLDGVDVRGAGSGGVVIAALGGRTTITNSRFTENRGQILTAGGDLDMQGTVVSGVAPLAANLQEGDTLRLKFNHISNTATNGATGSTITAGSGNVTIDVQGNTFRGASGVNLLTRFDQPIPATFQCNSFIGGSIGLSLKSRHPTLDGSRIIINTNTFLNHLSYGLTSDVGVDARNNWWGEPSGPFDPIANPTGTGDKIGISGTFQPWLRSKPACTP